MCEHYTRHCSIICPTCNKTYNCRVCHDINEYDNQTDIKIAHRVDRFNIKKIICDECNTEQNISNKCANCNIEFGKYNCSICNLYDDDVSKGQYHCDDCGICRVGFKKNFKHCETCGTCVSNKEHECIVKNINDNCPICFDPIFDSRINPSFLQCGHVCHIDCLKEYMTTNYKCPICSKSIFDVNKQIENIVDNTQMPEDLQIDVKILCNDCNKKSTAKFHVVAVKCEHCESYNTSQI